MKSSSFRALVLFAALSEARCFVVDRYRNAIVALHHRQCEPIGTGPVDGRRDRLDTIRQTRTQLYVASSLPFRSWRNGTDFSPAGPPVTQPSAVGVPLPNPLYRPRFYRERSRKLTREERQMTYQMFCDLDGVLVDFEHGIRQLFPAVRRGVHIDDIHRPTMWSRVAATGSFFESLPWTREGKRLWNAIRPLHPDILTGVPRNPSITKQARQQKVKWCERELGLLVSHVDMAGQLLDHAPVNAGKRIRKDVPLLSDRLYDGTESETSAVNVITCWSHNKHHESGPGKVLIDDCKRLGEAWEAKGGIFIHHEGCVDSTIDKLYEYGILHE